MRRLHAPSDSRSAAPEPADPRRAAGIAAPSAPATGPLRATRLRIAPDSGILPRLLYPQGISRHDPTDRLLRRNLEHARPTRDGPPCPDQRRQVRQRAGAHAGPANLLPSGRRHRGQPPRPPDRWRPRQGARCQRQERLPVDRQNLSAERRDLAPRLQPWRLYGTFGGRHDLALRPARSRWAHRSEGLDGGRPRVRSLPRQGQDDGLGRAAVPQRGEGGIDLPLHADLLHRCLGHRGSAGRSGRPGAAEADRPSRRAPLPRHRAEPGRRARPPRGGDG